MIVPKKRGRKAIPKNVLPWNDPNITIQQIIENDLAGVPMEAELKMREEKLRKMREKKAQKKLEREKGTTTVTPALENTIRLDFDPLIDVKATNTIAPKLVFKDGKIVLENAKEEHEKGLIVVDNKKPYKLTSMSFRTKNHSAKWTEEETKRFYKAIEIFGADFSMIAKLFPTRNRDQIKNKFRKEEKVNVKIMDEAFKKNNVLGKRSIMERINNFNNGLLNNQELPEGNVQLERTFSNSSTDSMDLRIMEDIKNIFINEIKPRSNPLSLIGDIKPLELPLSVNENGTFADRDNIRGMVIENKEVTEKENEQEKTKNEQNSATKRENLLLKLF